MYDDAFIEFLKLETRLAYFFAQNKEAIPLVLHTYSAPKYYVYMTTGSTKLWDEPTPEKMRSVGKQLYDQNQDLVTAVFLTGHSVADTAEGKKEYVTVTGMTIDGRKMMAFFNATRDDKNKLILEKTVNFSHKPSTLEKMGSVEPLKNFFDGYLEQHHAV